jgi:hypothetical protein
MNISKYYLYRAIEFSRAVPKAIALLIIAGIVQPFATQAAQRERLVVLPFEIVDNTPVPGGEERNEKLLDTLTRYVGRKIDMVGMTNSV